MLISKELIAVESVTDIMKHPVYIRQYYPLSPESNGGIVIKQ